MADRHHDPGHPEDADLEHWGQAFDDDENQPAAPPPPPEMPSSLTSDEGWNLDTGELQAARAEAMVEAEPQSAPDRPAVPPTTRQDLPALDDFTAAAADPSNIPEVDEPAPSEQPHQASVGQSDPGHAPVAEANDFEAPSPTASGFDEDTPLPPRTPEGTPLAPRASASTPAPEAVVEPPSALEIDPLPLDAPPTDGPDSWLVSYDAFRALTQKLARVGGWKKLAAITAHALLHAGYARDNTRTAMLLDLARIHRDRLADARRAEQAFAALAREDPANAEALTFLAETYERRGDWGLLFDRYVAAVEATWDPNERLSWTQQASTLATEKMGQVDLAIRAWEHLWQLGDAAEEAARSLTAYYRVAGRWADLANFLRERADRLEGPAQLVALRELVEVKLSGEDAAEAGRVLEQIVERSPQDPIATLQLARVYAQRQDWAALARLGEQAAALDVPAKGAADLQQLVADALWHAGRLEQAVAAYDRILEADPNDHDGTTRKREYLVRSDKHTDLIALLIGKADATDDDDERASLLEEAATLAEDKLDDDAEAIRLWERRITIEPEHLPSYEALARLHGKLGDDRGVARALGGQLSLIKEPKRRIELLRRMGEHFASRMQDDDRAEGCWKEILSLDPSDLQVREELIALHRRRGNFESLNSALLRQIWLTTDAERALKLSRLAAENIDQNLADAERAVEAWRRVLDFSPMDAQALDALARHYETLKRPREQIANFEQMIRASDSEQERIRLALQVAGLWEECKVWRAAAATYERALRWDPVNNGALQALIRIYSGAGQPARAAGALEMASVLTADSGRRIELLRHTVELLPPDNHRGRLFQLRRVLLLSFGYHEVLGQLRKEADADPGLWPEVLATMTHLASQQDDPAARHELLREMATLLEEKLESKPRAFLALQATLLNPADQPSQLDKLTRIARATKRHEDLLALLDRLTTVEFDLAARKQVIEQRAGLCERDLKDPLRAFHERQRLLLLDPGDWEPLTELERVANKSDLWGELDAAFAQLWDRTTSNRDRAELLERREAIARDHLDDPRTAFDLLVRRFRLDPDNVELLRAITRDAEQLNAWDWLLPLLEAAQLAPRERDSATELAVTAALYEEKLSDLDRAFVLYAEAFVMDPQVDELPEKLEQLAGQIDRHEALAETFRTASAGAEQVEHKLALLRRIAAIYEQKLKQPARAIDIHRRLLDLKQDEMRSLEVMIAWHRDGEEWRDLRDRLHQWIHLAPGNDDRVPRYLEIATISQQKLSDPEAALEAYGNVLELDADNSEARQGLEGLVSSITEPSLRLRWLQMELKSAEGQRSIDLQLEIADIQQEDLQDVDGAVATLSGLIEQAGADGPAFAPLAQLLQEQARHEQLLLLHKARAEHAEAPEQKLTSYDQALNVYRDHLTGENLELHEELSRAVLELRPDDRRVRVRLAQQLRNSGRHQELCELLEGQLEHTPDVDERIALLHQLGRLHALNLGQTENAERAWNRILELRAEEQGALLALARAAVERDDLKAYVELRHRQAKQLPPVDAALVLCHLAEVCDEKPVLEDRMVPLYREARTIDPDNVPAMEALKGIGRRLKSLRPGAALLPLDGERELSTDERATRLKALGDASVEQESYPQAIDWYRRAVAMAPDLPQCWEALAAAAERVDDREMVFNAGVGWMRAIERSQPMDPQQLTDEAEQLYLVAAGARAAGRDDVYGRLVQQAHDQVPSYAPAALAAAESLIDAGATDRAHQLLHEILTHHRDELNDDQRVTAHYARGVTLQRRARREHAIADYREALKIKPLDAKCLIAMGEVQAEAGRVAGALEYLIRALTVVQAPTERGQLYFKIGVLWEDGLGNGPEAGACYEQALSEGLSDRDLLHRALRHYQRTGRLDESLEVVDGLLPNADDASELATLWQVRGEIFAAREEGEDKAVEAFDMALSYDPSHHEARDGLAAVLERRGDWNQLLQVLEASADLGTLGQRARAFHRMADICSLALGDPDRAEQYLQRSIKILPKQESLLQLEQMYAENPERTVQRQEVLGLLVAFGPPWFERAIMLAKMLLADQKPWAWTLLSPLLGVSQVDADLKSVVQAMRKEYERCPMLCAPTESFSSLYHPSVEPALVEVLTELERLVHPLGLSSLDDIGDGSAIAISPQTTVGKAFAAVAAEHGLSECQIYRSQELAESVRIINAADAPVIVVRTDVMQQLVHAEVGFLFSYALTFCRPGFRAVAALPRDSRDQLLSGLWNALGFTESAGKQATKLARQIREAADEQVRERWTERLAGLRERDPIELSKRWWTGVHATARRAGLLAGADLRQVFRVVARLEADVPRPRVVARLDELDEYVAGSEVLQDLVSFAASPTLGELIRTANVAEVP